VLSSIWVCGSRRLRGILRLLGFGPQMPKFWQASPDGLLPHQDLARLAPMVPGRSAMASARHRAGVTGEMTAPGDLRGGLVRSAPARRDPYRPVVA
jgi:hypothetical protein